VQKEARETRLAIDSAESTDKACIKEGKALRIMLKKLTSSTESGNQ
jgi:hypothetical protein